MYFDHLISNSSLENLSKKEKLEIDVTSRMRKTGTTIVGVIFNEGVVLGADTRATEGNIVAEKNCQKIHYISDNIYCCGAGTAADTEFVTRNISSKVRIHHKLGDPRRKPRVVMATHMLKQYLFRYQGYVGAALILGGVDFEGAKLVSIHPHGSSDAVPYAAMGSGSLAAISELESLYRPDLTKEEAMELVRRAIRKGIDHDMGSGSNVDLCIITKDGAENLRTYEEAHKKGVRFNKYQFSAGTTPILNSKVRPVEMEIVSTRIIRDLPQEEMEI